ncbi:MAG: recombination mediator RecR [Bacteroidia bacterium]
MNSYSSKLLEDAVNEFAKLPGIGRKTALRLVLSLLKRPEDEVRHFGNTIIRLRTAINYCKSCYNISETEICNICADKKRDAGLICVVEDIRDVIAIENTSQYRGLYHVLGGIINPMEGIGPSQLNIEGLVEKAGKGIIDEVIMALSTTMEGDTTVFYLYKKLKPFEIKISTIARGVAIGGELEYADEITLGRSIINRTLYENSLVR